MKLSEREKTYLRAAVQNAGPVGLVIILFDLLIGDLERVAAAIAARDVEKRSAELKHAFLILQQLEGSLEMKNGGQAAKNFARFYASIRSKLLEAHMKVSPEIIRQQINLLFDVRQAWQQIEKPAQAAAQNAPQLAVASPQATEGPGVASRSSWTA